MAGILISPRFDMQVRKRSDCYKKKHGSPHFRDVLRERCKARIKAKRGALFDKWRNSSMQELHTTFSEMVREEAKELTLNPLPPMESMEIGSDLTFGDTEVNLEEQLLLEEYEKVLREEEAIFGPDWEEQVICPVCELAALKEDFSSGVCCPGCKLNIPFIESVGKLKQSILSGINYHQLNCEEPAQFAVITDNLFLICESCGCLYQIA